MRLFSSILVLFYIPPSSCVVFPFNDRGRRSAPDSNSFVGRKCWLGWDDPNYSLRSNIEVAYQRVLGAARDITPTAHVRGLAVGVESYDPYDGRDPSLEMYEWNSYNKGTNMRSYIAYLAPIMPIIEVAGFPPKFIADTSRSGQFGIRDMWSDSCNIVVAGHGDPPDVDQDIIQNDKVDAFMWIKRDWNGRYRGLGIWEFYDENCRTYIS